MVEDRQEMSLALFESAIMSMASDKFAVNRLGITLRTPTPRC
jgi:hypothetical protein